jgi:predicted ATPase
LRNALDIARSRGAKSLELRTAMALGRLLRERGNIDEARSLVVGVYDAFTEGFETKDLRAARALIDDLGAATSG